MFFFSWSGYLRDLHSFPTRRSSDLCSELRWAYCNHKATYFASYLTGGDCVPDDQKNTDRKSGSAGMPRPISYAVFCLKKKTNNQNNIELAAKPSHKRLPSITELFPT